MKSGKPGSQRLVTPGVVLFTLLVVVHATPVLAETNVTLLLGIRDEHDSEERLPAAGVAADFGPTEWLIRPEIALLSGFDPLYGGAENELNVGAVHYWRLPKYRVHLAAGLALVSSSFGYNEGSSSGVYAHGGIDWKVRTRLFLGADLRWLKASDFTVDGSSFPLGYTQLAFSLARKW